MPPKQQSSRFDRSDLLSALALMISLGAIFVSIRQTTILKDQQEIMAQQQNIMASQMEGSVWPFLRTNISSSDLDGIRTVKYSITNKGVGPAKIRQFTFQLGDKTITKANELIEVLGGLDEFKQLTSLSFSLPTASVLAPNETHDICVISYRYRQAALPEFITMIAEGDICYCSIYDHCYGSCE